MRALRTFHIPALNGVIDVTELDSPLQVEITIDEVTIRLTKEQFDLLCSLSYDLRWSYEELPNE
jgi:hypothetical protein